jgi:hypothetical protein
MAEQAPVRRVFELAQLVDVDDGMLTTSTTSILPEPGQPPGLLRRS